MVKKISLILILSSVSLLLYSSEELRGLSIFSPRSQDINAARDIAGWHPYIHRYDAIANYYAFGLTPCYNQSLRPHNISLALFNNDIFSVSGSQSPGREDTNELLADYFGLSTTFDGNMFFKPLIRNFILDIALYMGFDLWVPGLYVQLRGPAVRTQWNLQLTEDVLEDGKETPYPAGYMAEDAIFAPYNSYQEAMRGFASFGNVENLMYGKICGTQTLSGLAALETVLGYDFVRRERGHVGINFRASAPTGSRPKGEYFFEPRVGAGKHWQIGMGFTGHGRIWEKDGEQELAIYVDCNFTSMLKARQTRSFDFCRNGFFSRYILLKEFDADEMFTGNMLPAINVTTLQCDVRKSIQVDMVFMFGYTYNDFLFDIGYNGWIRSREKICLRAGIVPNRYGLKGVQFAYDPLTDQPLNSTESSATIYETGPIVSDGVLPVFISTDDLDLRSAASPLLITQKIFWHFSHSWYNWKNHHAVPFLGIGAEIEFEGINRRNSYQPDDTTMGQASVWLKGGVSF